MTTSSTNFAMGDRDTMTRAKTFEIPPLHTTLETLSYSKYTCQTGKLQKLTDQHSRVGDDVNKLSRYKMQGRKCRPDRNVCVRGDCKLFCDILAGHASLLVMSSHGFRGRSIRPVRCRYLHCVVLGIVFSRGFDVCCYLTILELRRVHGPFEQTQPNF